MNDILKSKLSDLKLGSKNLYYKAEINDNNSAHILDTIAAALTGGVDIVELSGRKIPAGEFYDLANKAKLLTAQFDATFIIDERVDIAFLIEPDGIFLNSSDLSIEKAQTLLNHNLLIGTDNNNNADFYISDSVFNTDKPIFVNTNDSLTKCQTLTNNGVTHLFISNLITNSKYPQDTVRAIKSYIEKQQ